jgi:hypothetical protein
LALSTCLWSSLVFFNFSYPAVIMVRNSSVKTAKNISRTEGKKARIILELSIVVYSEGII